MMLPQALERVVSSLQSGDLREAERACRSILTRDPSRVDALHLLGVTLMRAGRTEAALEPLARACKLDPRFADAAYNHAVALGELERWAEALAAYDRTLALDAGNARAWNNRGNVLQKMERWAEAAASYERSVALAPDNAEAQWTKSIAHLLVGEFEEGWRLHEWRWKIRAMAGLARGFPEPLWLGDGRLDGKTILLHADQGFGDSLQMARYAPMVEALGAKVVLEVPAA